MAAFTKLQLAEQNTTLRAQLSQALTDLATTKAKFENQLRHGYTSAPDLRPAYKGDALRAEYFAAKNAGRRPVVIRGKVVCAA